MRFLPTPIPQLVLVELEPHIDERGFFARAWCRQEMEGKRLMGECVQANLSYNRHRATLRGMHFQLPPYTDAKFIRVISGAIHDVVLDLRLNSPTYGQWHSVELDAESRRALFAPAGCAHGYVTLADDTELLYLVSSPYHREASRGICWNAPALAGAWPFEPGIVSPQDQQWPSELVSLDTGPVLTMGRCAG